MSIHEWPQVFDEALDGRGSPFYGLGRSYHETLPVEPTADDDYPGRFRLDEQDDEEMGIKLQQSAERARLRKLEPRIESIVVNRSISECELETGNVHLNASWSVRLDCGTVEAHGYTMTGTIEDAGNEALADLRSKLAAASASKAVA